MNGKEFINYKGGSSSGITATLVNAVTSLMKTLYNFGQNFGSTIYRNIRGISC